MPDLWIPGIPRVTPTNQAPIPLGLQGKGKRLFTWHTFEAPYTLSATAGARYTNSQNSTPTFCFNPVTGELVQQLPANVGARTLQANGPYQHTNAYGDIHMQVEVIGYAARPFTRDLTAAGAASLVKLMNFLRSWGIPDQWAFSGMTTPPATYAAASTGRGQPDRSGHCTHSRWWANSHWDPGAIAPPWTIAPSNSYAPEPPPRKPETPAAPEWPKGWVRNAQSMLNALGYTDAQGRPLAEDDNLGPATEHATRTYQKAVGLDPDGKPGKATTASLEDSMTKLDDLHNLFFGKGTKDPFGKNKNAIPLVNLLWADAHRASEANAMLRALAARGDVDPEALGRAIADSIREDVVDAITSAGAAVNADALADEIGRRLTEGKVA